MAIGISAHLGWAATAVVAVERGALTVLRTDRIETAPAGDREALEPYHLAGGYRGLSRVPRPADPEATLRRGLKKQQRFTTRALARLAKTLGRDDHALADAGVLESRGRAAPDLERAIGSHTQVHVQEGLAVRASIRNGLEALGARVHGLDRKRLVEIACEELGSSETALFDALGALRPENGGAWRKEEKLAALAGWVAARR